MTEAERPVATMFGVYNFLRVRFEAPGGKDRCDEQVQMQMRTVARRGGHEPIGRVSVGWYDHNPGDAPAPVLDGPFDVEKVWCRALLRVDRNGARAQIVRVTCPRCGSLPQQLPGGVLRCPVCDDRP